MKLKITFLVASVLAFLTAASSGLAVEPSAGYGNADREREVYVERGPYHGAPLVIDVWTDQGAGAVYYPGERMRVYFRASSDCYVTIYNIDAQGYVHLLYPAGSFDEYFIHGGITYRVPSSRAPYDLLVGGNPGIEYVEAVASVEPFQSRLPWYLDPQYGELEENPWSLYGSDYEDYADNYDYYVERGIVRGDPFLAIESINRQIVPADYPTSYYATAYTSFYVDRRVQYPRYLCYDCHGDYHGFDPYGAGCLVFDMRIDRTWVYSPRIMVRDYRPRYYYSVRASAPVRYRGERHFWSSRDGLGVLRKEFNIARPKLEPGAPGYMQGGQERWKEEMGPSDLRKWKAGRTPYTSEKTLELKKRLETEGLIRPKQYQGEQGGYQGRGGSSQQWGQPKERQELKSKPESFEAGRKEIQREQPKQQETQRKSYQKSVQSRTRNEQQKVKEEQQKVREEQQKTKKEQQKAKEREKQNLEQQQKEKRKGPR